MKRYFCGMAAILMALLMPCQMLTAYAANGRIAFSDKEVLVGEEVSINMQVSTEGDSLTSADVMLSYDSSMLEFISGTDASGGAGSIRIRIGAEAADVTELTAVLNFKALRSGTAAITVSSQEVYDGDSQIVNIDRIGSSSITVTAPAGASANALLSELQISPGTLTPAFSSEVDTYTASVGADVNKITVSALAADGKANVVVSGSEDLQPGENQVVCTVTAEDGATVKTYTIQVTKEAGAEGVSTELPSTGIVVTVAGKTVTMIPLDEGVSAPEGFTECNLLIDGMNVQGWNWSSDADPKYCIFYGMNEAGQKDFYRYDKEEQTIQRYFRDPAAAATVPEEQYKMLSEQYNSLVKDYQTRFYIMIGLAVVAVLLLIVVIVLLIKNGRDDDSIYKKRLDDEGEELRVRQKPERRISKEERYLRGLEAEEELRAVEKAPVQEEVEEESEDEEEDFEFIDLGE